MKGRGSMVVVLVRLAQAGACPLPLGAISWRLLTLH